MVIGRRGEVRRKKKRERRRERGELEDPYVVSGRSVDNQSSNRGEASTMRGVWEDGWMGCMELTNQLTQSLRPRRVLSRVFALLSRVSECVTLNVFRDCPG